MGLSLKKVFKSIATGLGLDSVKKGFDSITGKTAMKKQLQLQEEAARNQTAAAQAAAAASAQASQYAIQEGQQKQALQAQVQQEEKAIQQQAAPVDVVSGGGVAGVLNLRNRKRTYRPQV